MLFYLLSNTPPYDPLRDPIWQFVGVVVAVAFGLIAIVGVIIALKSYRQQQREVEFERTVKELVYEIISIAPIATINKSVVERVKILFDGQPVENIYLLVLQIKNGGNVAIKPEDYVEPLQIIFKGNQVISSEILETNPRNLIDDKALKTFISFDTDAIKLSTLLLNPGESISIKVLLTYKNIKIEIKARIADSRVTNAKELYMRQTLEESKREDQKSRYRTIITFVITAIIILLLITFYFTYFPSIQILYNILNFNVPTIFIIIIFLVFLLERLTRYLYRKLKK